MDMKMIIILLALLLGSGIVIMALTNNIFLFFMILFAALAIFFYLEWKNGQKRESSPYTELVIRLQRAIIQCNPRTLGYLILRGDSDFQRITLGKMVGIIEMNLDSGIGDGSKSKKAISKNPDLDGKGWDKMLVIGYKEKYGWIWNLPIISSLVPIQMFAVAHHQLWDKPGVGDLRVKGVSIEPVYCFMMLNAVDLDKDYIAKTLSSEVERVTLEQYFNKLPSLIDNAVKSDGFQLKVKELVGDKNKTNTGIVT